ncbi:MAG: hypothetical protein DLM69_02615 [Candidatus Chloroheliales bacterium]|nr:MAG: hypothetical protein DLM69_02615 [Chloroflexota bacterium]
MTNYVTKGVSLKWPRYIAVTLLFSSLLLTIGLATAQGVPQTPPAATATIPATYTPQVDVPPPDPDFSTPVPLGPGSRYYSEWPQLVAERDGSLSIVWDWGERDRLLYIHSTDQGRTWTPAITVAGNDAWGGAVGNQTLAADSQGKLHLGSWELYGSTYPHVAYRRRNAAGVWQPGLIAPDSITYRMKGIAVGVDPFQSLALALVGKGAHSLGLFATDGAKWTGAAALPLTDTSYPNPTWLPAVAVSARDKLLVVWGDHRLGQYNLWSAYTKPQIGYDTTASWNTYAFTDTYSGGGWVSGDRQYSVRLLPLQDGSIGAAYEGRDPDSSAKDIYYREWNPARYGSTYGGWQQYAVRLSTMPIPSEAPFLCQDGRGQRYVFWQDYWNNLRIVYTYSADGISWHPMQRVNAGPYSREKHPQCAVSDGKLVVVWDDRLRLPNDDYAEAHLYFASRPLPDLYPPTTATPGAKPAP